MKETPLISIIIPIYKVESYLRRCVDSVLNQSYRNLEIILVDDGSPDQCPAICNEYAEKDKRIVVVHKTNGGLSDARNAGIEIAKGEYLSFIDSDDFISVHYVQVLLGLVNDFNADVAIAAFHSCSDVNFKFASIEKNGFELSKKEVFKLYTSMTNEGSLISACSKLYKKTLFESVRFPKGLRYEDAFTTYKLLDKAVKIGMTRNMVYCYCVRNDSIMGNVFDEKSVQVLDAFYGAIDYFSKQPEIRNMFYPPLLMREIFCWWGSKNVLKNDEMAKDILISYKENCKKLDFVETISKKWKLAFKAIAIFPWLYSFYRKISPVRVGER